MEDYLTRMDRQKVSIETFKKNSLDETHYWLTKSPIERLVAMELLRQRYAQYDYTSARLQRVYTVRGLHDLENLPEE